MAKDTTVHKEMLLRVLLTLAITMVCNLAVKKAKNNTSKKRNVCHLKSFLLPNEYTTQS